ncbi:hypothetical protein SY88_06125 [Clostridiales bacterium PH28_bin88]|nr:hypothetical protein SY88_06125 [Clostridiales bacterium PH28_bin88]
MKKSVGPVLLVAVLLALVATGVRYNREGGWLTKKEVQPAAGKVLEEEAIKVLKGEIPGDLRQAERRVVEAMLAMMDLTGWLEQSSLSHRIVFGDIHPAKDQELIVAVSMGKDQGVVGVFVQGSHGYALAGALDDLVPVTRVGIVGLPGLPYKALAVDQYLDEMFGAFFEARTKAVYVFKGRTWEKAWERDRYRKEYYPEGNELKGHQTRWLMTEEKVDIVFLPEGRIEVNGVKTQGRGKTLGDIHGDYIITGSETISESYLWDRNKAAFKRQ